MKRVKRGEEQRTRFAGGVTSARKSKQAYLLSCSRPLNKQAGYHITNIYLTPPQKVWRGLCVGEGAVPKPFWPNVADLFNARLETHQFFCLSLMA